MGYNLYAARKQVEVSDASFDAFDLQFDVLLEI